MFALSFAEFTTFYLKIIKSVCLRLASLEPQPGWKILVQEFFFFLGFWGGEVSHFPETENEGNKINAGQTSLSLITRTSRSKLSTTVSVT